VISVTEGISLGLTVILLVVSGSLLHVYAALLKVQRQIEWNTRVIHRIVDRSLSLLSHPRQGERITPIADTRQGHQAGRTDGSYISRH
jgi:cell division protein FtsL